MRDDPAGLSPLIERVIGSAITVHRLTGAGLLESVYKACLATELRAGGLRVETECLLPVVYKDLRLEVGFRADMIVEKAVLIEVKAVEALVPVHNAQVITYLKLTDAPLACC